MPRTLLAHEWIETAGGAENVLLEMQRAIPTSRTVAIWNNDPIRFPGVEETWIARSPLRGRKVAAMFAMQSAWQSQSLDDVDAVVASSHLFAHHLASHAARHHRRAFAYVHTPARYVWSPELDARGNGLLGRMGRRYFQRLDASQVSPDVHYAANSRYVADRIARVWGVAADVIYPPVDVERIRTYDGALDGRDETTLATVPSDFVLGASRLVPYKRVDAAIDVGEMMGLPVVIAGSGPELRRLQHRAAEAKVPVTFLGRVSDALLYSLYRRTRLYVFLPVEDFGIMPVEAMAAGAPVLVNRIGGAAESAELIGRGLAVDPADIFASRHAICRLIDGYQLASDERVHWFSASSFRRKIRRWTGLGGSEA